MPAVTAPAFGTTGQARPIAYDPALVPALKQDHHDLVALFSEIGHCAKLDRFDDIPKLLVSFKTNLEAHLIAENVRFYNYVERTLEGDSENTLLIRSFRREMNAIARGVVDFVKKYQLARFDVDTRRAFMADYEAVGDLLAQRIQREEASLYPLYQPI
ncbi:hemerythrin domain-containing protein [Marilutibacter alkalisoli]|nr:hemerythrin domain-containing protein [Lysobacter alkalisoli]